MTSAPLSTLTGLFDGFAAGSRPFIVHDDGYRSRTATYAEVAASAESVAVTLTERDIVRGEKVVIWSENSIEWIAAFWGAVIAGVVVVPVDYRSSSEYLTRIAGLVDAKAILVGEEVKAPAGSAVPVISLRAAARLSHPAFALRASAGKPAQDFALPHPALPHSAPPHSAPPHSAPPHPAPPHSAPPHPAPPHSAPPHSAPASALAEILFTSGATAEPKGVLITQRNLLANILPIARELPKYRKFMRPFEPIRFLNLLPMSHLFGQSMATFIPPLIDGTVVFTSAYNPQDIARQIKSRKISVLVCVPKMLEMLAAHVRATIPSVNGPELPAGSHWLRSWWRYREVHRLFGWKFWCIVSGAAPLDPELERFWRRLGFLVVQGYGLTETAPMVTLNHPLRPTAGSVGRPIAGVDVKIADDGEVLVRGENVSPGYYQAQGAPAHESMATDSWLHTGDVGELDASGRLTIKGRKKEMIVAADGTKIFPEDVERVVNTQPGVRESAVVGVRIKPDGQDERVHAVVVTDPGADLDAILRAANTRLESHQRIRAISRWPADHLPRTEGTQKLKRVEIQRWASAPSAAVQSAKSETTVESVVERFTPGAALTPETTLDELGLSSLTQIEVLMALEDAFQISIDEASFAGAKTIAALRALVDARSAVAPTAPDATSEAATMTSAADPASASQPDAPMVFPAWSRSRLARAIRRLSLPTWILPLLRPWVRLTVDGIENLDTVRGPVVFASSHQSLLDVPVILQALPPRLRYRVAPAMAKEMFAANLLGRSAGPKSWGRLGYGLACLFFNAFPLPQREPGTRGTMRYIGELAGDGESILIFPEGHRTDRGEIAAFKPGVAMIASRLELPVVPIRIEGLDKVLHTGWRWAVRGPVRVVFGKPLTLSGTDYQALAERVEYAVRALPSAQVSQSGVGRRVATTPHHS